jgi:hypothetical protein
MMGQPQRCECHECTQARWKQTFQYQLETQILSRPTGVQADPLPKEGSKNAE